MRIALLAAAALAIAAPALADPSSPASPLPATATPAAIPTLAPTTPPATPAASSPAVVPAGTMVTVELVDAVSTRTIKRGDTFAIRLAAPILLGDKVIAPAGTPGIGQVVDGAPSGALGKPAKLLLAARYLDLRGTHVPLHAMRLFVEGQDNTNAIMAASFVPYVGILASFAHGGEIDIPAKTQALAKLGVDLPATAASMSAAGPPTPATSVISDEKGKTP